MEDISYKKGASTPKKIKIGKERKLRPITIIHETYPIIHYCPILIHVKQCFPFSRNT
jgi:hypothetical protein